MIVSGSSFLDRTRTETPRMLELLGHLVTAESPSADPRAVDRCLSVLADAAESLLGVAPERVAREGRTHLRWRFGPEARVVLLAHADTVWPVGTLAERPFLVEGDVATGPGVFDMKAGLVQMLHALALLDDLDGVHVLVTTDEEIGSPTSRSLVEETALGASAVLVLEPSEGGALKTARKGVSMYDVTVRGRAAHAGLAPAKGVNAAVELAAQVLRIAAIGTPRHETTVTPTVTTAGTTVNTVPDLGRVAVDVRAWTPAEQDRVDDELRNLQAVIPGAVIEVQGGPNRPPMEQTMSAALFSLAQGVATNLGIAPLTGRAVGGASDGNFTAGLGVPTLDGLGAVGGGAHAVDEHVMAPAMVERTALLAGLVTILLRGGDAP